MKIALLAPLHEAVPPHRYGGTERVLSWLTEELVRRGHEVTLFASGDSQTAAQLVPVTPVALRPCAAKEVIAPHLDSTDLPVQFACLYGDAAARSVGYTPMGLSPRAGYAVALDEAAGQSEPPERAACGPGPLTPGRSPA